MPPVSGDEPRASGLGMLAIRQKRRVLSYDEPEIPIHPLKVEAGAKSAACCPMFVADLPVGILYVFLNQERQFSAMELLLLDNFVNQAALAIAQMRRLHSVRKDLARKEEELSKLRRAGLLISSRLRLDETLEAILQMALEVTGAKYGIFRLVDKENQNLVMRALAGENLSRPLVEALPINSNSVMAWVARNRAPVCIDDLKNEAWSEIYYPLDAQMVMQSELAVPLIGASGRLEGVLNLESPELHAFGEEDSHLLQSLATQAVIAIQEARLLDALHETTEMLLSLPYQQVLQRLVDLACELLNAVTSAIWVLEGDRLTLQASSVGQVHSQSLPLYRSLVGQAILKRDAVATENAGEDPGFHRPDLAQTYEWTRVLVVPLLSGSTHEPVGAFSVYGSSTGNISNSDWDKKVLNSLAHYAALAVHRASHELELRAAHEKRAVAEAFAAVGDIAANLLHHLNNKVGTIPVRIQGIQDKCQNLLESEPYLARNLEEIERSARQAMIAMRESLIHLNPIYLTPVNIESCVQEAISEAQLPPAVSIQMIGLGHLPAVYAGRKGLVLVFVNLIQNAVEAMKGAGYITIHGIAHNDNVEVAVSDNGPGVSTELQERIFEFDFSSRTGGAEVKLGFGLWWVKTWMARMGGAVAVESDGQHGATFRLRLPFAVEGE
jgi:GAF domain-containing protein